MRKNYSSDEDSSYVLRHEHHRSPLLGRRTYRLGLAVSLLIWAALLLGLVWVVKLPTFLQRDDFSALAQIAANLSAICLALLGFVQADNPANKYLKLALAALSLEFVLSTLLSVMELVMINAMPIQPFQQTVTFVLLIGVMVSGSVANLIYLKGVPVKLRQLLALQGLAPVNRRRLALLNDAVPLWLPPVSVSLWIYPLNLASAALMLLLGGLTYLLVMSVLLIFTILAQSPGEDTRLKAAILEILRAEHAIRCSEKPSLSAYKKGISGMIIFERLLEKQILKNPQAIEYILVEMVVENLIFVDRYSKHYYILPGNDEVKRAVQTFISAALVITVLNKGSGRRVYQNTDWPFLSEHLSLITRYPVEATELFFLPQVYVYLEKNFPIRMTVNLHSADDSTQLCLFARPARVRTHYLCFLAGQSNSERSIASRNSRPVGEDLLLQALKSFKLVTVPYDLNNIEYKEDVKKLIALSLEHILSADGYQPTTWQEPPPSPDQEEINKLLAVLDLPPGSTWDNVRTAFSNKVRQYHPDANANLNQLSQEIQDQVRIQLAAIIKAYTELSRIMKPY